MINTVRTVAVSLTAITTVGRMSGVLRDEDYRELLLLRTGHRRFIPQSESFARALGLTPRPGRCKIGHDLFTTLWSANQSRTDLFCSHVGYVPATGRSAVSLKDRRGHSATPEPPLGGRLDQFRCEASLTYGELWLRYFALGGMSGPVEVEAFLYGALVPSVHDYDVVAHALNERFVFELGGNYSVPYSDD